MGASVCKEQPQVALLRLTALPQVLKRRTLSDGSAVRVEQCEWQDLHVEATRDSVDLWLKAADHPLPFAKQDADRRVSAPALVCVRNFPRALHQRDYRNAVIALQAGGVPCINRFGVGRVRRCSNSRIRTAHNRY